MYHCIRDCIHTKKVKSFNPHLIHREGFLPIEMYQISVSSPLSFRPLEIFSITILCSLTWEHENWTQWTQCIHSVSDEEHLGDHYILSSGLLCLIPCEISQDSETLVWWVAAFTDSYTKRLNVIWSMIASDKGWQSWVKFYYSYCRQCRCRWWLQGPAACTAGLEGHRMGRGGRGTLTTGFIILGFTENATVSWCASQCWCFSEVHFYIELQSILLKQDGTWNLTELHWDRDSSSKNVPCYTLVY